MHIQTQTHPDTLRHTCICTSNAHTFTPMYTHKDIQSRMQSHTIIDWIVQGRDVYTFLGNSNHATKEWESLPCPV